MNESVEYEIVNCEEGLILTSLSNNSPFKSDWIIVIDKVNVILYWEALEEITLKDNSSFVEDLLSRQKTWIKWVEYKN